MSVNTQFLHVAVGGTFDHFHRGHEALLTVAFSLGWHVSVGITDDTMSIHKKAVFALEPYAKRYESVQAFLKKNNMLSRATLFHLHEPLGPLVTDRSIEAVVIGPRVSSKAIAIARTYAPVLRCPTVYAADRLPLSSTRIRLGHISRDGIVYTLPTKTIYVPANIRTLLKKPLGTLIKNPWKAAMARSVSAFPRIITVGDVSTKEALCHGIFPHLAVVDGCVQRKQTYNSIAEIGYTRTFCRDHAITVSHPIINPAGCITRHLSMTVQRYAQFTVHNRHGVVRVSGEDDLATLLCILAAPLASVVLYGQPNKGLVVVEVTERVKHHVAHLISRFTDMPLV